MESLLDDARCIHWDFEGALSNDEVELDERVNELETKIRNVMDKHAPVKSFKVEPGRINWLTDDLKAKIKARNDMRTALRTQDKYGGNDSKWRQWIS